MYKVIFYGFGGQGLKTAAEMLVAGTIFFEDKHASLGLKYGVQRRGGIVRAFLRMDDKPIVEKSNIYEPDCIVVCDPMLLKVVNVSAGLKEGAVAVLNSTEDPKSIDLGVKLSKIGTVDATTIADEIYGSEEGILLTGMPMMGAFCKTTRRMKLESVLASVKEKWSGKAAERDLEALKRGYNETKVAEFPV